MAPLSFVVGEEANCFHSKPQSGDELTIYIAPVFDVSGKRLQDIYILGSMIQLIIVFSLLSITRAAMLVLRERQGLEPHDETQGIYQESHS
jgi:hypothetical protein